jgi:hypothetical protein
MNRLLPILVLFSLIFAFPSSADPIDWSGSFSGQADGFQRGDRIVPGHMNQIDAALDSIKLEVDDLTSGGGDAISVDGTSPSGSDSAFDLISGAGMNITLDDTGDPDTGTFAIDLRTSGGLELNGVGNAAELSLLSTCGDGEVLESTSGTWACAAVAAGGTNVNVNGGSVSNPNFNSTTPAAGAGVINIPLAVSGTDVAVQLTLNNITDVGTLTEAVTIQGALTLSDTSASLQFSEANSSLSCPAGDGAVGWSGSVLQKCEGGIEGGTGVAIAGTDIVDPIQIDSNAVTDSAGVNFLGGDGVTVTHADGVSPDTATVAVDLGTNQGLEINSGTLGLINDCADTQVLAWNDTAGTWGCAAAGAGGSAITVNGSGTVTNLAGSPSIDITDQGSNSYQFTVDGTAINELGTLTSELVVSNLGTEYIAGDALTNCSTFTSLDSTNGGIFYDDSEGKFKKCENGTLSDLAPDVNNITGSMNITGTTTDATNLLELIPSVDGGGSGAAGQPAFRIFGFDPQTGGAGSSVNTTDPIFDVYHNGAVALTNNLTGGPRGLSPNWSILPSGIAQFDSIEDADGPGTNWSIAESGAAQFNRITDSDPSPTWSISDSGAATLDNLVVGEDIGGRTGKVEIGGESTVTQLIVRGANGQPGAGVGNPLIDLITFDGTSNFKVFTDGEIQAEAIQDLTGPGTNFSIAADGTAEFNNTTVENLTSIGTLAHSGGTATLSSGATDTVALGDGAGTLAGKVELGGTQDQPQLVIEGHSAQTDSIVVVQDDADTEVFNVNADGAVYAQSVEDMEWCEDEYSDPPAGGGEQTSGTPDGVCDVDGLTLQPGRWGIAENGRANFTDIKFNGCEDIRRGTNVPQTDLYSDGLCDNDGRTPARGQLSFNDSGFKGSSQYAAGDGEGAGQNTGEDDRDGFISTRCSSQAGQFLATETGCEMHMAVGRRDSIPHITLKDGVFFPDNPNFELSITQIEIGAPIVPTSNAGSTAAIAMAGKTITGAIAIDYLSDGDYLSSALMTNKWFFINGNNLGATLTITLGAPASTFQPTGQAGRATQDGRSACFYAASSDTIVIRSDDGPDGSDIMLNGTLYAVGTTGSPSITSSGSQGDFVCLMSANPNADSDYEWYVLGQSGTWTGAPGS